MTDPVTPEKLLWLAESADQGELERFLDGAFVQTADALRAAADEIERLTRQLDDARPTATLTDAEREFAERYISDASMMVRMVGEGGAPRFVPLSNQPRRAEP